MNSNSDVIHVCDTHSVVGTQLLYPHMKGLVRTAIKSSQTFLYLYTKILVQRFEPVTPPPFQNGC